MKKSLLKLAAVLVLTALAFWLGAAQREQAVPLFSAAESGAEDPLEAYKASRSAAYAQEKAQLRDIAHASGAEAEIVALARSRLLEISSRERIETNIEGCLKLRGMDAAVSANAYCCYVFVKSEMLTSQQSSIISQLVCAETGLGNDNVKIIPMNYGNF